MGAVLGFAMDGAGRQPMSCGHWRAAGGAQLAKRRQCPAAASAECVRKKPIETRLALPKAAAMGGVVFHPWRPCRPRAMLTGMIGPEPKRRRFPYALPILLVLAAFIFIIAGPVLVRVALNSIIEHAMKAKFAEADEVKHRLNCLIESGVPAGGRRSQVRAWFDKHRVQHIYLADTTGDRRGDETMPMLAGLRDQDLSGMERGWIEGPGPDDEVGHLEGGRVTIYFFFDKGGKMVGHYVDCFVYCP